jgi:hypothetical protein
VHEGLSLSPKDRFVFTPYLYSYQVQPFEIVWAVADLNLHGPNPRIMTAGEHREDKEGEFLSGLDMVVALFLPV